MFLIVNIEQVNASWGGDSRESNDRLKKIVFSEKKIEFFFIPARKIFYSCSKSDPLECKISYTCLKKKKIVEKTKHFYIFMGFFYLWEVKIKQYMHLQS